MAPTIQPTADRMMPSISNAMNRIQNPAYVVVTPVAAASPYCIPPRLLPQPPRPVIRAHNVRVLIPCGYGRGRPDGKRASSVVKGMMTTIPQSGGAMGDYQFLQQLARSPRESV